MMGLSMISGAFVNHGGGVGGNEGTAQNLKNRNNNLSSSFQDFVAGGPSAPRQSPPEAASPKQMHESVKASDLMMSIINQ